MTEPALAVWQGTDNRYRRSETSKTTGIDDAAWERAVADVLRWRIKTRSGFKVLPDDVVVIGARPIVVARGLGIDVGEPVEVVEVVRHSDRVGFAYRTLPGHPVDGEEAFILHRTADGIALTIRSLTRPSKVPLWRAAYPLLRIAQAITRRRYLRSLR